MNESGHYYPGTGGRGCGRGGCGPLFGNGGPYPYFGQGGPGIGNGNGEPRFGKGGHGGPDLGREGP